LPPELSFEEGTFIEPLACVIRGQRLSGLDREETLLIIGAGIAGILHTQLAKTKNVKKIIVADINSHRLKLAQEFGAHKIIDARENVLEQLKAITGCRLADQVIVCTGAAQAALTALDCVDKGGTIVFFAVPEPNIKIPVPITKFWRDEITLKTSYGASPKDLTEAVRMLSKRKIDVRKMISHTLSLQDAKEGFRLVAKAGESLKVILQPNKQQNK
jgi:L-iditol 2-dehydrogenase